MKYNYPTYDVDLTTEKVAECRDIAQRLLEEVGLRVNHEKFVNVISKHNGVSVKDGRVYLSRDLTDVHFDKFIKANRKALQESTQQEATPEWSLRCGGYSIAVIDIETDEVRSATTKDLRDLIRLCRSLGITGDYPCTPQEVPPLMRTLACFKTTWEESDSIRPFDYLDKRQLPFLFEMHRVMDKPMTIVMNIPEPFTISEHDIDTALNWYPKWQENHDSIAWYSIADYAMLGITRPISASGSITAYLSQSFGTYILWELFDPEMGVLPRLSSGMPVDLQTMAWSWGSPRQHLYQYMDSLLTPLLCGITPEEYKPASAFLSSGSCTVDARSGMERMGTALVSALQGARRFYGAGNLAVDDLFSGVQLLADVEIVEYIREVIESFIPHPDLTSTEGLFDIIKNVALTDEEYYSHMDTAKKVRNLLPVSKRRPGEKLRTWMTHEQHFKDRLREECLERINNQEPFNLANDKKLELQKIYDRAEKELAQEDT